MIPFEPFHHRLRILVNIEVEELIEAGAILAGDAAVAARFRENPFTFFIKADDATAIRIWQMIELRAQRTERGIR